VFKRIIFLPDGNPDDIWAFSGITYYFGRALRKVCQRLSIGLVVVDVSYLPSTEALLWGERGQNMARGVRKMTKCELAPRILDRLLAARGSREFAVAATDYYERTASYMKSLLGKKVHSGDVILSLNPLDPYLGRVDLPVLYYLDCSVVNFYFHARYGTVPRDIRESTEILGAFSQAEGTALAASRRIFCFSKAAALELARAYGLPGSRFEVVGAGINFPVMPKYRTRRKPRNIKLLFVGRDFERKGGPVLLRAFSRMDKTRYSLTCVTNVVEARPWITDRRRVTVINPVSKQGMIDLFNGTHVFIAPTHLEPYGLAIAEAMAFAMPVIASRIFAIPEILGEDNEGLVSEEDGEESIIAVLSQITGESERYSTLSRANYLRAAMNFDWDRAAEKIVEGALREGIWL
jgi:glycosyltransferase involved in cell wall biosynthesis